MEPHFQGGPVRPEGGGFLGGAEILISSETCEQDI